MKKYPKVYHGYKKLLKMWEKSQSPNREVFIKAIQESIEEIEEQVYLENSMEWDMV